ncbi:hypothetical protein BDW68DRAFT_154317 [Aspergillus falconensis]
MCIPLYVMRRGLFPSRISGGAESTKVKVGSGDRCFGICFIWGFLSSLVHICIGSDLLIQ